MNVKLHEKPRQHPKTGGQQDHHFADLALSEQAAQQAAQQEARKREQEARDADRRIKEKEGQLDQKLTAAEIREKKLKEAEERTQTIEKKVTETLDQVKAKLEQTSSLSQEEAKSDGASRIRTLGLA